MRRPVALDPAAERDVAETARWYRDIRQDLAEAFVRALDVGLARISRMPDAYTQVAPDVRRILLGRYPFALYYMVDPEEIAVIACLHVHRDPGVWKQRAELYREE